MIFAAPEPYTKNHFFEKGLSHPQNPQEPARKIFAGLRWLFEKQFTGTKLKDSKIAFKARGEGAKIGAPRFNAIQKNTIGIVQK